jgi:mannosyltransferase
MPASAEVQPHLGAEVSARGLRRTLDWPRLVAWPVGALTALALVLRLAAIHQSLFGDELTLYGILHAHSFGYMFPVIHNTENTPPLFFMVVWPFAQGSDATVLVRVPSLLASIATVPLVYWLGVRTLGRGAGVVGAAWFAISPFALFYGTEARAYAAVTALAVLSTVSLLTALEQRRLRWWAAYVVASAAAIYTHYTAALVLIPQAVWALWAHRESVREQLSAGAVLIALWLPWLPSFLVQAHHSEIEGSRGTLLNPVTLTNVAQLSGRALIGDPFVPLRDLPGNIPMAILAALLVGLLAALIHTRRGTFGHWRRALASPGALILLLALAPPLIIILYSLRPDTSFFAPRNLSVAVPYALLLFGRLLSYPRPRIAVPLSLAALALVAIGTAKLTRPQNERTNVRGAARFIEDHAPPSAPVVISEYPLYGPPGRAISVYLNRPQRIRTGSQVLSVWRAAARTHAPLFASSVPELTAYLAPPRPYAMDYRLRAQYLSQGLLPLLTSEYVWR